MSVYYELTRLEALAAAADLDPLSCPRDRHILRTKIAGLEQEARDQKERTRRNAEWTRTLGIKWARVMEINEAERQRLDRNVKALRATIRREPQPKHDEMWEVTNIQLWEMESHPQY